MTLPFPIPDWLPWWALLAVLVVVLLYLLVFLIMPFSVFGLKGRLDLIDARLEEIQIELRMRGVRAPEPHRYAGKEAPQHFGRADQRAAEDDEPDRPPSAAAASLAAPRRRGPEDAPPRVEPRLDWPQQ